MPPHSRAQRRRQNTQRPKERPVAYDTDVLTDVSVSGEALPTQSAAPRQGRQQRRGFVRSAPEPLDYTKDYHAVRRDLRLIALWSVLLFGSMIALWASGLVQ